MNILLLGQDQQIHGNNKKIRHFPHIPKNYDASNLAMNLRPENKKSDIDYASMTAPYSNYEGDVAHEVIFFIKADYESEDYDF